MKSIKAWGVFVNGELWLGHSEMTKEEAERNIAIIEGDPGMTYEAKPITITWEDKRT